MISSLSPSVAPQLVASKSGATIKVKDAIAHGVFGRSVAAALWRLTEWPLQADPPFKQPRAHAIRPDQLSTSPRLDRIALASAAAAAAGAATAPARLDLGLDLQAHTPCLEDSGPRPS